MELINALSLNETLISLNVSNNHLSPQIGREFRKMLEKNKSIVSFQYDRNNFTI